MTAMGKRIIFVGGAFLLALYAGAIIVGRLSHATNISETGVEPRSPDKSFRNEIGKVYTINPGLWPCGSSESALGQMIAARDHIAQRRIMVLTRSLGLTQGLWVKIIEVGFGKRMIEVLGLYTQDDEHNNRMRLFTEDPRTGRTCWTQTEALGSLAETK